MDPPCGHFDPQRTERQIQGESSGDIVVRELGGGRCVSLVHQGAYDSLSPSYARVFAYLGEKGLSAAVPTREVYLKGPGMIFRGNPKRYLTEIQVFVQG